MLNLGQSASLKNRDNKINTIKIPSELKELRKVSSKILDDISSYKVEETLLFDIRLCVDEAVRNAMVHGNRCEQNLSVTVNYWVEDSRLVIEVEDEGKGFDHKNLPDPTSEENIMRNSGRGVYLIRRLMDEVAYNETGNKIRMAKRII